MVLVIVLFLPIIIWNLKLNQYASSYSIILYSFTYFFTCIWVSDKATVVFRKSLGLLSDIDLTNICTFSNRQLKMSLYIATDLIRKTTDVWKHLGSGLQWRTQVFYTSNFYLNTQIWSLTVIIFILPVYLEAPGWFCSFGENICL